MKRSGKIALSLMVATALVACSEPVQVSTYETVDACVAATKTVATEASSTAAKDCQTSFDTASALHQETAPRFKSKEDCEEEFGVGKCEVGQPNQHHTGSTFIPFMAGYMMGNVLNGNNNVAAQPLYRSRTGSFVTSTGYSTGSSFGKTTINPGGTSKPAASTTTISRGGFGGRGGGSFGG